MRVGIVYDCFFPLDTGGGERVYRAMADAMLARGHNVTYLTRHHEAYDPDLRFRVEEVSHAPIHNAAGDRTLGGALQFSWGLFRHLVRNRNEFDLVVASALPVLTLLAARVAMLGARAILVADWLEVWPWKKWRQYSGGVLGTGAAVLQWIGARVTKFNTVNSRFTAERLRAVSSRSAPIVMGLFDLAPVLVDQRAPSDPPFALFVGRWIQDKRVDSLPSAIAYARMRVPGLECVIVGGGREEQVIRTAISSASADSFVQVLGRVDDSVLDDLMSRAVVLVNPSAREGFGLVLTEAAARGVPAVVVAGEDNASAELIVPGINGYVAANESPSALGDAIADAVLGGSALRASTARWFATSRIESGFGRSVDVILALVPKRRTPRK